MGQFRADSTDKNGGHRRAAPHQRMIDHCIVWNVSESIPLGIGIGGGGVSPHLDPPEIGKKAD